MQMVCFSIKLTNTSAFRNPFSEIILHQYQNKLCLEYLDYMENRGRKLSNHKGSTSRKLFFPWPNFDQDQCHGHHMISLLLLPQLQAQMYYLKTVHRYPSCSNATEQYTYWIAQSFFTGLQKKIIYISSFIQGSLKAI